MSPHISLIKTVALDQKCQLLGHANAQMGVHAVYFPTMIENEKPVRATLFVLSAAEHTTNPLLFILLATYLMEGNLWVISQRTAVQYTA